jgi:hypothetical protein
MNEQKGTRNVCTYCIWSIRRRIVTVVRLVVASQHLQKKNAKKNNFRRRELNPGLVGALE